MREAQIERPSDPRAFLRPGLLVGDEWRYVGSGGEREHVDPATGRVQQLFHCAGPADVDAAASAARAALVDWARCPAGERQQILQRLGELVRVHADELATINALEVGTPAALSAARYRATPNFFDYYAGWIDKVSGDTFTTATGLDITLLEPVGVVGAILTWNHPLANIQTSVAPALAAGCCVVIKPPEQAPFAAIRFGRLCDEAGIPRGVVSILPGGADVGEALVRHQDVDMISFVGGSAIGRRIQAAAAPTLKPLLMELGGKSPSLVFADADLDEACRFAMLIAANSGQGCTIPTRMLIHDSVYDEVVQRLVVGLAKVGVGDPFESGVQMGPLINESSLDRVLSTVHRAVSEGSGTLVAGGDRIDRQGFFMEPTVFRDVAPDSDLWTEEVFGPVLATTSFSDEEEALALANASRYGLAAYVHTSDVSRALRVTSRLDAGNIGINGAGAPAGPFAPFGGFKQSGYGKVGGLAGMMQFLRVKNVQMKVDS